MRLHHWRRVGLSAAARKSKQTGDLERFPPLFPSLLAVKATSPAKPRKHNNYFILFFLLRSGSSGSDSQFVVLSFFRWQICHGAWRDSPVTRMVGDPLDQVDRRPLFLPLSAVRQAEV